MMLVIKVAGAIIVIGIAGLMAWIRLAPVDVRDWHAALPMFASELDGPCLLGPTYKFTGTFACSLPDTTAQDVLARLDGIALNTPRTRLIAGSPGEGRMTWETRSWLWGFPDYTTAQVENRGATTALVIHARQRFGREDAGVNRARVASWLAQLSAS